MRSDRYRGIAVSRYCISLTATFTPTMHQMLAEEANRQGMSIRALIRGYVGRGLSDARYGDGRSHKGPRDRPVE